MNIGLLSSKDDLLLSHYINKLQKITDLKLFIFYAYKKQKEILKDEHIFRERTKKYFEKNSFDISKINKFYFKSHNSRDFKKKIKLLNIDYLLNSGTPNKIQIEIIKSVKGVINIHPGILPYYRGSTCVEWALYNNDPIGITAHLMTEKYDVGPIILKRFINLKNCKTYQDIRIRVYLESIHLIKDIFIILKKNKIKSEQISNINFYKIIPSQKLDEIKDKLKKKKYRFHKKNF